jgi:hypothetical protein
LSLGGMRYVWLYKPRREHILFTKPEVKGMVVYMYQPGSTAGHVASTKVHNGSVTQFLQCSPHACPCA